MTDYKFSFGPWNINDGADVFGPSTRQDSSLESKIPFYKDMGVTGVQLHDDDAVPGLEGKSASEVQTEARQLKSLLDDNGLTAEFVAPRLWEETRGADGGYTANKPEVRQWAIDRSIKAIDIAKEVGCDLIVLWLAREGTYIREAKDTAAATGYLVEAINKMLEYDKNIRIAIEPKPNEPMDHAFVPTMGHGIALSYKTVDQARVGVLMESAHSILANLDPADEIAFAMSYDKLFSVHLNDQNSLKFDEDKAFGSVNLRRAFNQVYAMERAGYGKNGEFVGLDVKCMRTEPQATIFKHLENSKAIFLRLVEIVRGLDQSKIDALRLENRYEELDYYIMTQIMA